MNEKKIEYLAQAISSGQSSFYHGQDPEPVVDRALEMKKLEEKYRAIKNHPFSDFSKNKIVFGVGNLNSPLVFVGEGPGRDEDIQGKPFVGRAGKLLTKIIEAMGLSRDQVYITNVIKCRLPDNRAPKPDEIEYDKHKMLLHELKLLKPEIICTLGSSAMYALLGFDSKIGQCRGQEFQVESKKAGISLPGTIILPTYHPAYLLRNPSAKQTVWQDMLKILQKIKK